MMKIIFGTKRERRRLALSGKLDLRPAYVVMTINLIISYVSSVTYSKLAGGNFVSMICEFGFRHIPAVRGVAILAKDADACAFAMTFQWLLGVLYVLIFVLFLFPFSNIVKVAVDKSMRKMEATGGSGRMVIARIAYLVFVPVVFLGDIGLIQIPTFFNGGLFAPGGGDALDVYFINSAVWMPTFLWLVVLGTFFFYWSWFHIVGNYKTIFNV